MSESNSFNRGPRKFFFSVTFFLRQNIVLSGGDFRFDFAMNSFTNLMVGKSDSEDSEVVEKDPTGRYLRV